MSISALYELQKEMNRIGIAGVPVAIGDIKLKKIYEETNKTGEKVAVFKKIAELVKRLMETGEVKDFYELSRLSSAVLYTQGSIGKKGELIEIETNPLNYKTTISFRKLNPVIEALTTKGSGRLEIIRDAYENGVFEDLRIIQYLIYALGDSYGEIADFVFKKLIEVYGETIVPIVKKDIDFKGKNEHARRIDIISSVAKGKEKEFYLEALEKGSKEVKMSAIKALKDCPENLDIIIEYTKDKNKDVRALAYAVIGTIDSKKANDVLIKAFNTPKDFNNCIEGIENSRSEDIAIVLIEEANKCLEDFFKDDKKEDLIDKMYTILGCMENKKYDRVYEFLKNFLVEFCELEDKRKTYTMSMDGKISINLTIAGDILINSNKEDILEFLVDLRSDKLINSSDIIKISFIAALKYKNAKDIFDMYSIYLKQNSTTHYKNLIYTIKDYIKTDEWIFDYYDYHDYKNVLKNIEIQDDAKIDKRWLRIFMNLNEIELVCRFANKEDTECTHYILEKIDEYLSDFKLVSSASKLRILIFGLLKAEFEEVEDMIIYSGRKLLNSVMKHQYDTNNSKYYLNEFFSIFKFLSKCKAKEMEAFRDEIINELREKNIREDTIEYFEVEFDKVTNYIQ